MSSLVPRPSAPLALSRIERQASRGIELAQARAAVEVAHVRAEEVIAASKVEAVASVGATAMAAAYTLGEAEARYAAQSPNGIARISYIADTTAAAMNQIVQATARRLS